MLRKVAKYFLDAVAFTLIGLIVAFLVIWFNPGLVINTTSVVWVLDYLEDKRNISSEWSKLNVSAWSESFNVKTVRVESADLCVKVPSQALNSCVGEAEVSVSVSLFPVGYDIERIDSLVLTKANIYRDTNLIAEGEVQRREAEKEKGLPVKRWIETFYKWYAPLAVGKLNIDFDEIVLKRSHGEIAAQVRLHKTESREVALTTKGKWQAGDAVQEWDLDVTGRPRISEESVAIMINLALSRNSGGKKISGTLSGSGAINSVNGLSSRMDFELTPVPGPFRTLKGENCKFLLPAQTDEFTQLQCQLSLPLDIPPKYRRTLASTLGLRPGEAITVDAEAKTKLSWLESDQGGRLLEVYLSPRPVNGPCVQMQGEGSIVLLKSADGLSVEPSLDLNADVTSFKTLTEALSQTQYAIPAPLNVMDGTINTKISGRPDRKRGGFIIPLATNINLASGSQVIKVASHGKLDVSLKPRLKTNLGLVVQVSDLTLQLPRIDPLQAPPTLTADRRFRDLEEEKQRAPAAINKQEGPAFTYDIRLGTQHTGAIKVSSNLVEPHVPIGTQLRIRSGKGTSGQVQLGAFQIGYLRREAEVERIHLDLPRAKGQPTKLNGLIRVNQADYDIFIELAGTLESPQVNLRSEPELSRQDIISVLIFNRRTDELAGYEEESVGSMQAAMTDGALGLFGIWLFASTPIESVAYNPQTKNYAIKARIAEGLTVTVGTDWEQLQLLQFRKRLSEHWVLTTTVGGEGDFDSGDVILQWENRY